ncbi:MAG: ABC transporter ATP-binding protein/permease [Proteobacteria bacterium]|nr:ABC transporter ATP-binding protein/permease [Pseudomonadota bacterium]
MLKAIRLFFQTKEANHFLVILCLLLASISETIGIGTLLPVIAIAAGIESPGAAQITSILKVGFDWLGLPVTLGGLVALVAVFMTIKAGLTFAALAYAASTGANVSRSLRQRLTSAIFNARWGFFSDQRAGQVSNTLGTESSIAGEAFVVSANVVSSVIQTVAYAVIALFVNWKLALLGVATGFILSVGLQSMVTSARRASYKLTDQTNNLLAFMVDALANIKPLKTMHRYDAMLVSVGKIFGKLKRAVMTRELSKAGLAQAGTSIVAIIAALGIYLANSFLHVPFPDLLVSAIIFNQIVTVSTRLQRMVQVAAIFEGSYVRTLSLIEEAEAAREYNPGTAEPRLAGGFRFDGVDFSHGKRRILTDVSLEIPVNRVTVFSGPSGAGKTTIIDLLIGLHKASSGTIHIGDKPINEIDLGAWRHQIGYVPQELNLFHASVRTNLTLGDETVSDDILHAALDKAGASEFIRELSAGLDTDIGEMGSKLSGGQRQRISLARALVANPKVLILDEVTSALDPETEAEIVRNIATLRGEYTIIAITHRPAWTDIADRLYTVSAGTVKLAAGTSRRQPAKRPPRKRAK